MERGRIEASRQSPLPERRSLCLGQASGAGWWRKLWEGSSQRRRLLSVPAAPRCVPFDRVKRAKLLGRAGGRSEPVKAGHSGSLYDLKGTVPAALPWLDNQGDVVRIPPQPYTQPCFSHTK